MHTFINIITNEEIMVDLFCLFVIVFVLYLIKSGNNKAKKEEEKNKSATNFSAKVPPDGFEEDFDEYDQGLNSCSQNYYAPTSTHNYNNKNNDEFYKRMAFTMAYINNRERQKAKTEERNAKRYRNSKSYKNSKSSTSSRRNRK